MISSDPRLHVWLFVLDPRDASKAAALSSAVELGMLMSSSGRSPPLSLGQRHPSSDGDQGPARWLIPIRRAVTFLGSSGCWGGGYRRFLAFFCFCRRWRASVGLNVIRGATRRRELTSQHAFLQSSADSRVHAGSSPAQTETGHRVDPNRLQRLSSSEGGALRPGHHWSWCQTFFCLTHLLLL